MGDITLSSAVRNNLLSLQNTAKLMAATQERLATGKKVNSALDNPTNFFTASALDSRASDINRLLDGVGNGVQTLKAADTGITSLLKLVDSAKATARQALQASNAYTEKASIESAALTGVTADALGTHADLDGLTLVATAPDGTANTITFGNGVGEVETLEQLNAALKSSNMEATITDGETLKLTTLNSAAANTFALTASTDANTIELTGTAFGAGETLAGATVTGPTFGGIGEDLRTNLVADYNDLLTQITKLAKDSSFNGVNLLNGDDLTVTFNEDGSSTLEIKGVTFDASGLGLTDIADADFKDSESINKVLGFLDSATTALRTQASKFGSNLSVVQVRQDFSKSLINVLQTGSANLTLADTNEEGANLLALQTRQQLSTTALSLSSQADQAVLRLF